MVKTFEELKESLKTLIGESTDDTAISFIEDFTDTFTDMQGRTSSADEWKNKAESIDAAWREKYRARFFESETEEERPKGEFEPLTYDSLFDREE